MTTGTRTIDGRFTVNSYCAVSPHNKAGPYYTKTWSGGDRGVYPINYVQLWDPKRKRYYKKRLPNPNRRFTNPNWYQMTLTRRSDPQVLCRHPSSYVDGVCGYAGGDLLNWTYTCIARPSKATFGGSPWTNNHDWDLLGKLHEKIWGSTFDPGIFLAEAGKSLDMIGDSARRLARFAYYARKLDMRHAWQALGTTTKSGRKINVPKNTSAAANHWAQVRWGIMPLLQDMHDGAIWVSHLLHSPALYTLRVRRSAIKTLGVGDWSPSTPGVRTSQNKYTVRKQIVAYLSEPPNTSFYNGVNPLSVAWELVPLSFVVDWALPIGRFLQLRGLPSMLRGTFVTTVTEKVETRDLVAWKGNSTCPVQIVSTSFGDGSCLEMSLNRSVSTSLAVPDIEFRGFEKVATWKHAVDSLALLTQRWKKLQID